MLLFRAHSVGVCGIQTGESAYMSYDGQGLVSSETDYNGDTTFYACDGQGHIIQVSYPDGSVGA